MCTVCGIPYTRWLVFFRGYGQACRYVYECNSHCWLSVVMKFSASCLVTVIYSVFEYLREYCILQMNGSNYFDVGCTYTWDLRHLCDSSKLWTTVATYVELSEPCILLPWKNWEAFLMRVRLVLIWGGQLRGNLISVISRRQVEYQVNLLSLPGWDSRLRSALNVCKRVISNG